jgi:hypothetical protein
MISAAPRKTIVIPSKEVIAAQYSQSFEFQVNLKIVQIEILQNQV